MAHSFHFLSSAGRWAIRRGGGPRALEFGDRLDLWAKARARADSALGAAYLHDDAGRITDRYVAQRVGQQ